MPASDGAFQHRYRCVFVLCLWFVSITPLIFSPVSLALTAVAGDIAPRGNPDGKIDSADVILLQRMVLGEVTPTADELLVGDVAPLGNPDGALTMADVLVLQRAVLGEVALPAIITGPPAPADLSKIELIIGDWVVTVVGAPGSVQPNSTVTVTPWAEAETVVVTAGPDGSFTATLYVPLGTRLTITVSNSSGETSTPVDMRVMKITITSPRSGIAVYGGEKVSNMPILNERKKS